MAQIPSPPPPRLQSATFPKEGRASREPPPPPSLAHDPRLSKRAHPGIGIMPLQGRRERPENP
jgi:hypothetical protein